MYAFFTCKCINKSLDLDGLVKFPWPWNMYLYSSGLKKHGMIAPWDDSSHSPQVWRGKAEPFWPTVCCRSLSLTPNFLQHRNAVEREGCRVRFDSSIDTRVGYNDWLQTMKHALRSSALFLSCHPFLATCDVENHQHFDRFLLFYTVSSCVKVFIYHLKARVNRKLHYLLGCHIWKNRGRLLRVQKSASLQPWRLICQTWTPTCASPLVWSVWLVGA